MTTWQKLPESLGGYYVKVEWEVGDEMDDAGDGHCFMHHADGYSNDNGGNFHFTATAVLVDGSVEEIEDVEFVGNEE